MCQLIYRVHKGQSGAPCVTPGALMLANRPLEVSGADSYSQCPCDGTPWAGMAGGYYMPPRLTGN